MISLNLIQSNFEPHVQVDHDQFFFVWEQSEFWIMHSVRWILFKMLFRNKYSWKYIFSESVPVIEGGNVVKVPIEDFWQHYR